LKAWAYALVSEYNAFVPIHRISEKKGVSFIYTINFNNLAYVSVANRFHGVPVPLALINSAHGIILMLVLQY